MNINVPENAIGHFWEEPPEGATEFWAFRFRPPCEVGDELIFRYNKKPIATAIAAKIEPPGESSCAQTGKFKNKWKVLWTRQSFKKVEELR